MPARAPLPDGWVIDKVLENVPNPNNGTIYGNNYFTRWTYICTDTNNGQYVASSGDEGDCYNQALSIAQSNVQTSQGV